MSDFIIPATWNGIETTGGPLLLVPLAVAATWRGILGFSGDPARPPKFRWQGTGSQPTDYDRACDVPDPLGVLSVGGSPALVIGEESASTAVLPSADGRSVLLATRVCGPDEAAVLDALAQVRTAQLPPAEVSVTWRTTPQILVDSSDLGDRPTTHLPVHLPDVCCGASTWTFSPTPELYLDLFWIRPVT